MSPRAEDEHGSSGRLRSHGSFHDEKMCVAASPRKMRRGEFAFGNKSIAANLLGRTVIAIFAKHSTRFASGTIIPCIG
jgi:hypothetical protein